MLMTLVWGLVGPLVTSALDLLPDAPDPIDWVVPWPAWVPFWPFGTVIASVVVVGVASLGVRIVRWLYGLVPVIQ